MKGERGPSRSNKWNWNKSTSGFGEQQVEKGNATSGNEKNATGGKGNATSGKEKNVTGVF